MVSGSVAHQMHFGMGLCDGTCEDDPALTPREAAKAAARYFYESGIRSLLRGNTNS